MRPGKRAGSSGLPLRLAAQVEEIRTDRFRIHELQQQMQDLIQQIDGSLERAERRRVQFTGGQ